MATILPFLPPPAKPAPPALPPREQALALIRTLALAAEQAAALGLPATQRRLASLATLAAAEIFTRTGDLAPFHLTMGH